MLAGMTAAQATITSCSAASALLDQALAAAIERYRARHPASARQLAIAAQVLPGGNTRSVLFQTPFPLVMVRGEGPLSVLPHIAALLAFGAVVTLIASRFFRWDAV